MPRMRARSTAREESPEVVAVGASRIPFGSLDGMAGCITIVTYWKQQQLNRMINDD